jgi:hypothetical protein
MTKYAPLTRHLAGRHESRIRMGFAEIERLLGFALPRSARAYRPWWANSGHGHVQSRAWLEAGYESSDVDLAGERLEFVKLDTAPVTGLAERNLPVWDGASASPAKKPAPSGRHPLIGCMAGMVTIPPDADLTKPMYSDEEVDEWLDRKMALIRGEQR